MKPYPKIDTLFDRDETTFKVIEGRYRYPEFEYLADNLWMATEKVDGTNVRVMYQPDVLKEDEVVLFCGRKDGDLPPFLVTKLRETFTEDKMRTQFGDDPTCLYGEGYGARIQKGGGRYISDGVGFALIDVLVGDWWLRRDGIEGVAASFEIKAVPLVHFGPSAESKVKLWHIVESVRQGLQSEWGDFLAEGVVMRPAIDLISRSGSRIIAKLKTKDF